MRNILDFTSRHTLLTTAIGLLLASLLMVGIRLVLMQTLQRRRERENRQINERLRTLIAAYKTLGGSFTGDLSVDPAHKRDQRTEAGAAPDGASDGQASATNADQAPDSEPDSAASADPSLPSESVAERRRRTRDAVEAALSDIILLGTEEQVRLAATAANDMVMGRTVHLAALVHSLRDFIRAALGLEPIPHDVHVPDQGPLRPSAGGGGARGTRGAAAGGGASGGRGGGGAGGGSGGMGMGVGMGVGKHTPGDAPTSGMV